MNVLDLFSGIGGFSLGVERAGWKMIAFCEVSPICRHLLAHHWPEVPCYDDVQTLSEAKLRSDGIVRIDAIVGGFPCQDLSYAGKGAGLAGARSGLWREFVRLIGELRPGVVIVENVPALLNRGLGTVLADLAALGYDAEWDCIPASAVGAPHRRDRIWIVAYARGEQHEGFGDAFRRALAAELSASDAYRQRLEGTQFIGKWEREYERIGDVCKNGSNPHQGDGREPWREGDASEGARGRNIDGGGLGDDVADADCHDEYRRSGNVQVGRRGKSSKAQGECLDARDERCAQSRMGHLADGVSAGVDRLHGGWAEEPDDCPRVQTGVKRRVEKLHGLGNAVVPQIPEILARAINAAFKTIGADLT